MESSEEQQRKSEMEAIKMKASEEIAKNSEEKREEKDTRGSAMPGNWGPAAQLTIFYAGSVNVFDAVTAEKAQAIMLIAAATAAASAAPTNNKAAVPKMVGTDGSGGGGTFSAGIAAAAALTRSLSQQSSSGAMAALASSQPQLLNNSNASSLCQLQADLPIARRHSLQQFLEKRRSRLVSKAPYALPAKNTKGGMEVGVEGKPQLS